MCQPSVCDWDGIGTSLLRQEIQNVGIRKGKKRMKLWCVCVFDGGYVKGEGD